MQAILDTTTEASAPHWPTHARLGSLPRRGWVLEGVADLGGPLASCQACGYPAVRYVHSLTHPGSGDVLEVGCCCSEALTRDYATPRQYERLLRNRSARLRRLLDLAGWRHTRSGNLKREHRGTLLVLYRGWNGWRINVGDFLGRRDHPTPAAAIRAAFDYIDPPRLEVTP